MPLDAFDRIFIINLPERRDRLRVILKQIEQIAPSALMNKAEVFAGVRPPDAGGFPSIGKRGCFLSHLGVVSTALERGYKNILIVEDDADFEPLLTTEGARLVEDLIRSEWDIAYLGHGERWIKALAPGWHRLTGGRDSYGSHLIAINGSCLPALEDYMRAVDERPAGHPEGGKMGADATYEMFRALHPERVVLFANPFLAGQRSSRSDITPSWFDRIPGLRVLAEQARRVVRFARRKVNATTTAIGD